VDVVAFVGAAGTGKSFRAQKVARDENADAIIDDGLFIKGGKIWAGMSAKNEHNRIQAVKRAIFNDERHLKDVKRAIAQAQPEKLLILGTSEAMVRRISAKLGVPPPGKIITIEEIATKREIAYAKESRYRGGRHVVPVPVMELKPHYTGYLIDPFRGFFTKNRPEHEYAGKSIVRPAFSMYGKMLIADSAVEDIVRLTLAEIKDIKNVVNIHIRADWERSRNITINAEIVLLYGTVIKDAARAAQRMIKQEVEAMTAMSVLTVNISVRRLVLS
jgi:uncharacterized alkaline shock family protein YloU